MSDPGPRALLLDALGTLLFLQAPGPRLREQLRERLAIEVSEGVAGRAIAAEIAYYREHLDEGRDERSLARLRRSCAEVLSRELARDESATPPAAEDMTEVLLASLRFTRFPDALPALRGFKRLGLRMVVVSNWDASLRSVLDALGVSPFLDAIVTSAEFGARKPSAAIFERALALAGVDAAQAWHVGDSVEEDVQGARAAAIEPILIRREASSDEPGVKTVASLSELLGMLEVRLS